MKLQQLSLSLSLAAILISGVSIAEHFERSSNRSHDITGEVRGEVMKVSRYCTQDNHCAPWKSEVKVAGQTDSVSFTISTAAVNQMNEAMRDGEPVKLAYTQQGRTKTATSITPAPRP